MKKMLITVLLGLLASAAFAADPGNAGQSAQGQHQGPNLERMTHELNLSEAQKSKLQTLFQEQKKKREALHEEMTSQLKALLTAEQFSKFEQMREQRREKFKNKAMGKSAQ